MALATVRSKKKTLSEYNSDRVEIRSAAVIPVRPQSNVEDQALALALPPFLALGPEPFWMRLSFSLTRRAFFPMR